MQARTFDSIPTPRGALPLIGHWPEVIRDSVGFLERGAAVSDVVRYRFAHVRAVLTHDLAMIQHVLQQSPRLYTKSRNYEGMKALLGQGLLTSEGELWKRQRKLAQPAFHHAKLRALTGTMASTTSDMLTRWSAWDEGRRFDLHHEMMGLTLRIAGLTLFGADLDGEAREVGDALAVVLPWVNGAILDPFRPPLWVPTRANKEVRAAIATLDRLVTAIIEERRRNDPRHERADLLAMLMGATDEGGGGGMSDQQLRDEVLTLILAGHETTANLMSWTGMLLAKNPDWRERVEREARDVLGDRVPTFEDLAKLEVCDRVVCESMRLYPPAWEFEREAIADDVAAGYEIPKGTVVMIAPWTLHRHPKLWDAPLRFDPDRFRPERAITPSGEPRPRYAYLPFGDGPRVCIGKAFAMMEAKLLLAMIARQTRFELEPGVRIDPEATVTLRPIGGIPMRYRSAPAAPSQRERVDQTTSA
ncbi:MAG: cytochrome P450 [Myxococcota bacterium]|nr:cytochrome P450 [Myxococcota bacterium]